MTTTQAVPDDNARLREPPEKRFEGPEHLIDLEAATARLHAEHPPAHGHRQVVVYRHRGLTLALYSFEEGAMLPHHSADGLVLIQPLDGPMSVNTRTTTHRLDKGQVLTLDPGVEHDVLADEAGRMLLTVCTAG